MPHLDVTAILFDIDGTLVDSTDTIVNAWTAWARHWNVDVSKVLEISHGRRTSDTVAMLLPSSARSAAVADLETLEAANLGVTVALAGALGDRPAYA